MPFKCTFLFDVPKGGWGETWYLPQTTEMDLAKKACDNYAAVRAGMLGKFATLENVRITSTEQPRVSIIRGQNIPGSLSSTDQADTPWQAVYANIKDQSGKYQRISLFRGIPDNTIFREENGHYNLPGGPLKAKLDAILASLRANTFAFRARSAEGVFGNEVVVNSFQTDGTGFLQFTSPIAILPGDSVTFREGTGDDGKILRGTHKIRVVQGNLYTTFSKVGVGAVTDLLAGWKVRQKATKEFLVGGGELIRPAHRDTGRPFGLGRGRRPARR